MVLDPGLFGVTGPMPRFNSKFVGYIPENLKYVQRPATEVLDYWEHDFWDDGDKQKGVHLRETFVVDATNAKTLETAMRWARGYDREAKGVTVTERPNSPIATLEIISLDIRSEGGRAWKVLVDGLYYVDLREDVLLDTLKNGKGVTKGEFHGPFQWCGVGSSLKLVRVGSQLYQAVVEAGARKASKNVKGGELVLGGIYENRKGETFQYLGLVDCERYLEKNTKERYRSSYGRGTWKPDLTLDKVRGQQLWMEIPAYWQGSTKEFWTRGDIRNSIPGYNTDPGQVALPEDAGWSMSLYRLGVVKAKAVVGLVRQETLPKNHLAKIQGMVKENWEAQRKHQKANKRREEFPESTIAHYSWQLTLRGTGEPVPSPIEDYKILEDYVNSQSPVK